MMRVKGSDNSPDKTSLRVALVVVRNSISTSPLPARIDEESESESCLN